MFRDLVYFDEETDWDKIVDMAIKEFGDRGKRAIEGLKKNKVKKYRDFWVVVGDREHVVINDRFCDCEDYLYNISSKTPSADLCWHAIAVRLAKNRNKYDKIDEWYQRYLKLF